MCAIIEQNTIDFCPQYLMWSRWIYIHSIYPLPKYLDTTYPFGYNII